jgi:hypothetical protein
MEQNVGRTDMIIRIVAGVAIIAAGLYFKSWWGVIGVIPLATGALRNCPLYQLLKINTNKKNTNKNKAR